MESQVEREKATEDGRAALVARGLRLNYATIAYNALEAFASLVTGALSGSVALVGFGVDSVIELAASGAAQWRLRTDADPVRRATIERTTHRVVGWSFLALALYVCFESGRTLWLRERPERSIAGVFVLTASVVVMPLLARAKRRVASQMASRALASEARQTSLCAYLSAIALAGVLLNLAFGWWWADPIAAVVMVPIIVLEGLEGVRREAS